MKQIQLILATFFPLLIVFTAEANHSSSFGVNSVVIKSFVASSDGKTTKVAWELEELDLDVTCALERSVDGMKFYTVTSYELQKGFSGPMKATDENVKPGTYFYRLFVSKNGYLPFVSNVVTIKIEGNPFSEQHFKVQNPFQSSIQISGVWPTANTIVEIADMFGHVRQVSTFQSAGGDNQATITTSGLGNGIYILRVKEATINGRTLFTKRVMKQASSASF